MLTTTLKKSPTRWGPEAGADREAKHSRSEAGAARFQGDGSRTPFGTQREEIDSHYMYACQ
jgi:hypothetical protein